MTIRFAEIAAAIATPTRASLAEGHAAIDALLDRSGGGGGGGAAARAEAIARFDAARREYESWSALVHLRFAQDTADDAAKAARDYADALAPFETELATGIKRRLLADPDRSGVEALVGRHALRLWETDVTTFDPAIAGELEEEARLSARYTELLASARFEIGGAAVNLSGLAPFAEAPDRATRHHAERLRWEFFAAHGAELDTIYDRLVRLRHGMARKLGFETYTPLAYRRMRRLDYGPAEVARYRDQVAEQVVPLVAALLEDRRRENGWDRLRFWDEALIDPEGNPLPIGDHDLLVAQAQILFDRLDPRLGAFYRMMREGGFLDLKNRPGKAGGGFCTAFPTHGMPFIFANFTGTHHDIGVFTHEMGHAFQNWESRSLPGIDLLWPTMEAAEIHSMGLEFLAHPQIGLLVGEAAAPRFRRMHLIASLAFLPYGVCVDHFQHEVYASPEATPAERHALWQRLERRYMPWTDYGDLDHPAKGGRWQAKGHIYGAPFYYIDYTLALCCALQLWTRSRQGGAAGKAAALDAYVALCGRGGSAPFQELAASAGLASPFAPGALAGAVREAERALRPTDPLPPLEPKPAPWPNGDGPPGQPPRHGRTDDGSENPPMADSDDDEVDLGISLETVATVVDHARALQGKEEGEREQLSEDDDSEAALLQEDPTDMTEEALHEFINGLNEDERAALIALAWTGRGDYDAGEWEEALRLARERNEGRDTAEYLLNMEMLGDLLAEGVAAFGLSIEDVDR